MHIEADLNFLRLQLIDKKTVHQPPSFPIIFPCENIGNSYVLETNEFCYSFFICFIYLFILIKMPKLFVALINFSLTLLLTLATMF